VVSSVKLRSICSIILAVLVFVFLSGCDFFWGMPWGKAARDPSSQIGVVRTVNVGDNSIALAWDWRPFLSGDLIIEGTSINSNREIVELRIMHGVGSPPALVPPLPFGEAFQDRLDPSGWYKVFDDLQDDSEHYFSIYGKEKSGEWVGPWTVSRDVGWSDGLQSGNITWTESWNVNIGMNTVVSTAGSIVDSTSAVVFRYDSGASGDAGFIDSAQSVLIAGLSAVTTGIISFYPLRWDWDPADANSYATLMETAFTKDDVGAIHKQLTGGDTQIELTEGEVRRLLNRMVLFSNGYLYIEASNGGSVNTFNPPGSFNFQYWRH
jgi:hypothetical protein